MIVPSGNSQLGVNIPTDNLKVNFIHTFTTKKY